MHGGTHFTISRKTPCRFSVSSLGLGGTFGFCFNVSGATAVGIGLDWASSVDTDPSLDPVDVNVFSSVVYV